MMKETKTVSAPEGGVTLTAPVVRGNETLTYVEIGEEMKQSGSLRGLSLIDVLNMKTESMVTLLARVTSPRLKESEIKAMTSADFIALSLRVVHFLAPGDSGTPNGPETEAP